MIVVVANNQTEESSTRGFVLAQIWVQLWKELASEWWGGRQHIILTEPRRVLQHPPCAVLQEGGVQNNSTCRANNPCFSKVVPFRYMLLLV